MFSSVLVRTASPFLIEAAPLKHHDKDSENRSHETHVKAADYSNVWCNVPITLQSRRERNTTDCTLFTELISLLSILLCCLSLCSSFSFSCRECKEEDAFVVHIDSDSPDHENSRTEQPLTIQSWEEYKSLHRGACGVCDQDDVLVRFLQICVGFLCDFSPPAAVHGSTSRYVFFSCGDWKVGSRAEPRAT